MKAALLSALEATMSCDFMISNVRHLDRTEREKCISRPWSAATLCPKYFFFFLD